ncbi:MAG TPA: ADYC domain-containing protein [Kofleriaceae bacterium]
MSIGLLVSCTDNREPEVCFPLPAGAEVTSLEGQVSDYMQGQGTTLQGTPGMQNQGTSLQGDPPFMQNQGTSLQGDPPSLMQQQGTSLQGDPGMTNQGTSLQGDPGMTNQGTSLQGGAAQAGERARQPRSYKGLGDLNGAHLVIAADASNAVTVKDGQLVARGFPGTASLKGTSLTGIAADGRTFRIELVKVTLDGRTERVDLLVDGLPACQLDQYGVFVPGRWDAKATHVDDPDVVTYSCMDGVIAKCVSWGYAPWLTDTDVHASCTRLARADYCGNGVPWTMDGTEINIYDTLGILSESTAGDMKFEAAWGTSGALCVSRPRYQIEESGRMVLPGCFASLPRCSSLDEAGPLGAVLANRSRVTPIEACK